MAHGCLVFGPGLAGSHPAPKTRATIERKWDLWGRRRTLGEMELDGVKTGEVRKETEGGRGRRGVS